MKDGSLQELFAVPPAEFTAARNASNLGGHMIRSAGFGVALLLGAATAAAGQSPEEQALCQDDAFRLCSQAIPDRERTFQCMVANKELLSAACRTVMARLLPPDPPHKATTRRIRKGQGSGPVSLSPTAAK